jgi:hypothetical protein
MNEPTPPPADHILQFFAFEHLPPLLKDVSRPFCELAHALVSDNPNGLPRNPERTVALRKLLEAKDAAVRAALAK